MKNPVAFPRSLELIEKALIEARQIEERRRLDEANAEREWREAQARATAATRIRVAIQQAFEEAKP